MWHGKNAMGMMTEKITTLLAVLLVRVYYIYLLMHGNGWLQMQTLYITLDIPLFWLWQSNFGDSPKNTLHTPPHHFARQDSRQEDCNWLSVDRERCTYAYSYKRSRNLQNVQ